jgi:hypothetical protein
MSEQETECEGCVYYYMERMVCDHPEIDNILKHQSAKTYGYRPDWCPGYTPIRPSEGKV